VTLFGALLTACASMCTAIETAVGPQVAEWIFLGVATALGWWKLRKVQATASAGVAAAQTEASKAKDAARAAHVQIAEIRGSMRPAALPASESGTSISGHYEPVRITETKPRASLTDPELSGFDPLPRPSGVPDFETRRTTPASEAKTRPDSPNARRK
jgi:hypothetical protein